MAIVIMELKVCLCGRLEVLYICIISVSQIIESSCRDILFSVACFGMKDGWQLVPLCQTEVLPCCFWSTKGNCCRKLIEIRVMYACIGVSVSDLELSVPCVLQFQDVPLAGADC